MRTRRILTTLLAGAGLVAGFLAGAGPAAAQTAATGQIVYEQSDAYGCYGTADIWIMNPDGTGQTNITNTPGVNECDPELSPDGSKVVFISNPTTDSNPDGNYEVFTINVDGTNLVQVTNADEAGVPGAFVQTYDPTWSPDGMKIAFSGYRANLSGSQIFTINADGTGEVNITTSADFANKWEPDWSPDGSKILYTWGWDEYSQDLHTINPDGTGDAKLTPETVDHAERNPVWSPDGSRIAFRWDKDCCGIYPNVNAEIYIMEYPSGVMTRVTEHNAIDEGPTWSPDGSQIVFSSLRNGTYDLFVVDAPAPPAAAAPAVFMTATADEGSAAVPTATPLNTAAGNQQDPFWGGAGGTTPPPSGNHTLTVTRAGDGTGSVSSNPAGIKCGSDCTESYAAGTSVTLTAKVASGTTFAGWSGDCSGTTLTCTVTMDAAKAVTATFTTGTTEPPPPSGDSHTLTVTREGDGTGSVSSNPAGIKCGSDCTESYATGTSVTLTAKVASGTTFAGWSGDCSGTTLTCTVTMDGAKTVAATFTTGSTEPPPPSGDTHTLTVTREGAGRGRVTSSPAGISCGTDCSEAYASGTAVTLTATPASGSTFTGWSGACSGTATTCTVTMDAAKTATATFA